MKNVLITIVAVLLIIGSYLIGRNQSSESPGTAKTVQALPEQATLPVMAEGMVKTANGKVIPEKTLPLPPANMPLNDIYVLLQRRADNGDGKAACRIAIELVRCQQALNMNKFMTADADTTIVQADRAMKPVDQLKMANSNDEHRLAIMEKANSCSKISSDQLKQTFRYLRQAAHASQPDAMVAYVDGRGLEGAGGFAVVRSADFDVWRRDALPIAQRALQQGVPEAVYLLNDAYSYDQSLFGGLVADDRFRAETMRLLRMRIEGQALPVQTNLNASEYQRALSESEALFKNHFNGKVQAKTNFMKRLMSPFTNKKEELAPCE